MAITFAAIGSAAIISMMKTSVQSDNDARKTDIANAIARTWVERLRRDAMQWTLPNSSGVGNNYGSALLLGHAGTSGGASPGWFLPGDYMGKTMVETMSYGFDILGRDLALADIANATFCVHVREGWLVPPNLPTEPGLIRADVRVLWFRGISQTAIPASDGICDPGYTTTMPAATTVSTVYLTTTIKQNGQP